MTVKLNALLLILGGLVFGVGLILGLAPMTQGGDCGSAFIPSVYAYTDQCKDALSGWRGVALALVIPGVLLLGAGGVATISDKEQAKDVVPE